MSVRAMRPLRAVALGRVGRQLRYNYTLGDGRTDDEAKAHADGRRSYYASMTKRQRFAAKLFWRFLPVFGVFVAFTHSTVREHELLVMGMKKRQQEQAKQAAPPVVKAAAQLPPVENPEEAKGGGSG